MSEHTQITEADVIAWLTERAKEVQREFGGYGTVKAESIIWSSQGVSINFTIGADGLSAHYTGVSYAAALENARSESPDKIAAKKREEAARLLAEAEALEAKP